MADDSTFRGVIDFFSTIGLYDVVLPFILVFTIVFAILEKTKVLGMEKIGEKEFTRKNLNAMVAFVIAFLVIASAELVKIINQTASQIVILLILSVFFLLLVGSFAKESEGGYLQGGWKTFFMFIMLIGIFLIFLNAIKTDGVSWLEIFWNYVSKHGQGGNAIGSIILLIILVLFMVYIVKNPKPDTSKNE